MPPVAGHRYYTSTAVLLNEVIKLAIALTFSLYDISRTASPSMPATSLFGALMRSVFTGDSWKLAIPASLYTLSNSLQYVAVSNLDAATFQVTYQLKLVTTALFGVVVLRRSLSPRKWLSLILLVTGVAIVQIPSQFASQVKTEDTKLRMPRSLSDLGNLGTYAAAHLVKRSATYEGIQEDQLLENPRMNASVGLAAATVGCIALGWAGVYLEKIMKESNTNVSLWVRNVQLSLYSAFPALFIGVVFVDGENIAKNGFFEGYNWVVWLCISLQAFGGLLVSLSVSYADTVTKNFATTISVVMTLISSIFLFNFDPSNFFILGMSVTFFGAYLYTGQDRPRPPKLRIQNFEKSTMDTASPSSGDVSIKLPVTPFKTDALTTSRPASPARHNSRISSAREYFDSHRDE
ncbi:MAG: hypothetical protein M1834_003061 [Cirrosporium novae-zelandiae]|nr:MAG: hypothetical protein M1834_003061 [Cirrosporium novae-zelandiae]